MQADALWRIPDPDYDRHPAYGRLFGRPRLADRLAALAELLPHLGAYAAYDVLARLRGQAPAATAAAAPSPVFEALSRDGVTALRFAPDEMAAIQAAAAPAIARLRAKLSDPAAEDHEVAPAPAGGGHNSTLSALHRQFNPRSTENELFIHEGDAPALFAALRDALNRQGALAAASRYQRRQLDVTYLKLLINHAEHLWWRAPFADVGLGDPPAISMHVDHLWTTKAILYLTPVGQQSGPFCYCLGSNHVRIGWLEGAARRANDRVNSVVLHARAPAAVPRAAQALPPQGQVRQRPRARSSGAAAPARERAPLHLGRRRSDPVRRPRHSPRRAGRGWRAHHAADPPRLTTRPSPWRRPRSWARSEAMDLPQEAGAGDRLRERYRDLQAAGTLRADPAQAAVVAALAALAEALAAQSPEAPRAGWLGRLRSRAERRAEPPPGVYLHGPVGRGKSLLMDLFFEAAPVTAKRRVHFHAFMLEVHARLDRRRKAGGGADPLSPLADDLIGEARLLCFDEFHVQNIADAMILGRLFEALLARGMVVVATSNFAPERLYEGGLNRDRFLPFIALLRERLRVLELAGATDYRLERLRDVPVWQQPLGPAAEARLGEIFQALTDGAEGAAETLPVGSRRLTVPRTARGVAWFDFEALCEQPLGAADYLALTERYHTVLLSGVPQLTPDKRNQARRFITLVDALYDRRINLVASAAAAPEALYPSGDGAFEFQRTVSRLAEMQSSTYVESPPLTGAAAQGFTPFALTTDVI